LSVNTAEVTTEVVTKEGVFTESPKSDKINGSASSSSKGSNKKRKIEEISNSNENAQTEGAVSCGESVAEQNEEPAAQIGGTRKRMKMNDGEANTSPAKPS
jgi:hypothetical protein